jgi:tetratricopeptide (TPR) repeat protein
MSHARAAVVLLVLVSMAGTVQAADKRADAARLYRDGKYDEALKLFQDLSVETHNPGYLCNIGRCQDKLGRVDEAISNIQQCLSQANPDAGKRAEYDALLAQLEARRRTAVIPPAGATAPSPGGPGPSGPIVAPSLPPSGPVTPPEAPSLPPLSGAAAVVATQPPPSGAGVSPLVIVGGSVAVVGIGAGVVFGLQARNAYRDTAAQYNPKREKDGDRANVLQIVGYGVAAVGVGMAIIGAVMSSKGGGETASAGGTLVAGPDGVGWTF